MASELAPGSEWMTDTEDGAEFIADSEGHRIDITVYEPKCVMLTVDEETAAAADVRDVLAIIDRAGLDPVRTAARELVELCKPVTMHSDGGRRSIIETAEKLKALL